MKDKKKRNFVLGSFLFVVFMSIFSFSIGNMKDSYAASTCPSGYSLVNSGKNCCPTGYTYMDGYCISDWNKPFSTTYEVSKDSSGNINCTHTYSDVFQLDLPILVSDYGYDECGCVAGTLNVLTQKCTATCNKNKCGVEATSITSTATKSCYYCSGQPSNGDFYQWATAPSGTCNGGSWTTISDAKSEASCKAKGCYFCGSNTGGVDNYVWARDSSSISISCNGGSWSLVTKSEIECKNSNVSCTYTTKAACENANSGYNCVLSGSCYVKGSAKRTCEYTNINTCQINNKGYECVEAGTDDYNNTCYVKGDVNVFTVHYDANGGTGQPDDQDKNKGVKLTLSSVVPTRSGYTFVGWSEDKNATGATYGANGAYNEDRSITLYAVWKVNDSFNVIFNNGTSTEVINVKNGEVVTAPSDPVLDGYTFDGWYTDKEYKNKYDFSTAVTSDFTLYAKWVEVDKTPAVDDKTPVVDDKTTSNDKTLEEIDKNSKTGDVLMFIAWSVGIGALLYGVYYYKTRIEE